MLGPDILVARTMQCWKGNWNFLLLSLEFGLSQPHRDKRKLDHRIHNNKHPQLLKCHSMNIHWNLDAFFFFGELPMAPMTRMRCPDFLSVIYVYRVVAITDLY